MALTASIITLVLAVTGAFYLAFWVHGRHPAAHSRRHWLPATRGARPPVATAEHDKHEYLSFGGE